MSEQVKENGPSWEPQTPADGKRRRVTRKHGKVENNNRETPDDMKRKSTHDIGTSNRKTRKKMKRHRPKVVNENKPLKPKTPDPKTPKHPSQVKKKARKKSVKRSCRQKLEFNEESSIVELKDVKPYNDFGIAEGSKVFKKKRKMRKELSLEKLIRLVGMIHEKSSDCESTILHITWIHLKRTRSRTIHTRRQHFRVLPYKDDAVATQKMESMCIGGGDGSEETANQLVVVDPRHQKKKHLVVLGPKNPNPNMKLMVLPPRHRRGKVDIDEESTRVWNLYLHGVEDTEEVEKDKKTCLEKERELFVGRVDAFINTMFLLSGDRRFTPWKGSVVDSVVGVFLTQNVSDSLSSNAFMELAARYPPPSLREQNGGDAIVEIDYIVHEPDSPKSEESNHNIEVEIDSLFSMTKAIPVKIDEPSSTTKDVPVVDTHASSSKTKAMPGRKHIINNGDADWDDLRKRYSDSNSLKRGEHNADTVDWKAVREASLGELAKVIESRGMNNQLAARIKIFLDLLVRDHGSIDLEWLRNVPPLKAKSYLMSICGLALKSTECVRLLSLYQPSFPIDVNVGRVLVRLGWVKLQPLPEGVPIHLLNDYPELARVQEYIWPRICTRDEQTLYEFHCYMNIFSKAFCTKSLPNCKACPMRGECKHYASSRPSLEGSQAKNETSEPSIVVNQERMVIVPIDSEHVYEDHCEPILEFPASPEPEPAITEPLGVGEDTEDFGVTKPLGGDIEDVGGESEIQTIILHINEMPENLPPSILDGDNDVISGALVSQIPQFAQIPLPKLKNVMRLRTEHTVYELPDSHPLLTRFQRRDPKDPCPYLLAIWTTDLCQDPKNACDSSSTSSSIVQYIENEKNVKGTILIPCRTANKGRFPLNGTYFQINEVFADHDSSREPINVPRKWIWNLQRRTLYCGTTITSICRGMTLKDIVYCFRKGYICIRGFDLKTRRPRLLMPRFHLCKTRQRVDK